ncbi:TlpA disulfide reductase family protein [Niameybacter massiliensis]|uniref:TlpA disulfide reductase family protein n=1 Tax=Holtiella tumoricola TaxID=3018743 RepID=A0AA42DMB6_9FIRM|nr:TlpA disulfide reductase family protein [Holtiella tumoricola]MDA3731381.1 TlpA disulfide reductase family protein [Holtiella tumoricola]
MKVIKKIVPLFIVIMMTISLVACGNSSTVSSQSSTDETEQAKTFPKFQGTDFDGNSVDESLFSKNEVTLLNFWFNGCSACVNEMPALEELNARLREKGAELVGINVEAGGSDKALAEAKEILSKQGATYRNLFISAGEEANEYIEKIFAFPTTVMVDKNGNIIGKPIVGSIEDEKKIDDILKMVDDVKAGKTVSYASDDDDKMTALMTEVDNIFLEHKDVWDKVFDSIKKNFDSSQKNNVEQADDTTYAEYLKAQIETVKDSFTEDELRTLDNDIKRIDEIDKQIQELDSNKDSNK